MKHNRIIATIGLLPVLAVGHAAVAAGDLAQQEPVEVRVELGSAGSDQHGFFPAELTFETGKLYKMVLHNPSKHPHYFTSNEFTQKIYTRKVQVVEASDSTRRVAEIKGAVREVEVHPGGLVEWWFVPVATGTITDLHCHVKDEDGLTHAEKGMTGVILIK